MVRSRVLLSAIFATLGGTLAGCAAPSLSPVTTSAAILPEPASTIAASGG